MIGGVCGGLGDYFDIDPTLVRILAVSAVLFAGTGVLAYIIGWIIIPQEPWGGAPGA
jgi:phage shock protein PspC (stress-responsive transcriptional regulator)